MSKTIYYDGADIDKIVAVYDPIGNYDAHWVTGQSMTKTNTATGSFTAGVSHLHHKIVADVITEMTAGEKTARPLAVVDPATTESSKPTVRATTTTALPTNSRVGNVLTADANGAFPSIDGVAVVIGQKYLDRHHATGANRGAYTLIAQGEDGVSKWSSRRTDDSNADGSVKSGISYRVEEGAAFKGYEFHLETANPITLNTTALSFRQGPMKNDTGTGTDDLLSAQEIDSRIATSKVGLYEHKGAYNASTNTPDLDTSPSGIKKGDAYKVTAAGNFFTEAVDVNDVLIADQDDPTLLSHWTTVQANIDAATTTTKGIVELATDGESAANLVPQANDARLSDSRAPSGTAGGGLGGTYPNPTVDAVKLDDAAAPDDNTDLDVSTTKHGLVPKAPNDAAKYLDGTGAYSVPAGGGGAKMKTGTYTGDGTTSKEITGIGFQPDYVRIWERETVHQAAALMFETTDTMIDDNANGLAMRLVGSITAGTNAIISLDADGFTVDDAGVDSGPNENLTVYNYMAMKNG